MTFLIHKLFLQADPNTDVRGRMINAGIMIIDKHGRDSVSLLFPIFENYLNKKVISWKLEIIFLTISPLILMTTYQKLVNVKEPSVQEISIWYAKLFPNSVGIRWREVWFGSWGCCYFHRSIGKTFGEGIIFLIFQFADIDPSFIPFPALYLNDWTEWSQNSCCCG